ncbi:hypothetical protein DMC30DRAFT_407922 [Rhodotorula diobovata]|uniref:DUF4042 domain-containing protein n=1 Tax=Rhodotorula diobovata TaxID=5288 RepID=A0A5C5G385_9BASI|nr:hypothetical protein DMC30DRAFT_407922 [Rhodotorula diobovata]
MNALDSARAWLAGPSTSVSVDLSQSTGPSGDLVEAWCEALEEREALRSEDKEAVVRALTSCRLIQGHDRVFESTIPLLLDPLPSLRLQAAACVLQLVSTAPVSPVQSYALSLVVTVSRALGPLPYQLPSASSTLHRFTSTCLRILNSLVLKVHPLPPDARAVLPPLLATWVYYGTSPVSGVSSAAAGRGRPSAGTPLSFGVMSAFGSTVNAPTRRRRGSMASNTSSRASSASRTGPASDSEDDGRRYNSRRDSALIRLDALVCLRSLALAGPRLLHAHWQLFLADSPHLRTRHTLFSLVENDASHSVRLRACAAIDALLDESAPYLSLAEDRSTSSSFTSLSAKLGETVSELHLALSSLLRSPSAAVSEDLRLALLALAAGVAQNSPYGRMKRALAQQLASAVLPDLDRPSQDVAVAAAAVLTAIARRYASTSSSQAFDYWDELVAASAPLLEETRAAAVQGAGWTLIASVARAMGPRDCALPGRALSAVATSTFDPWRAAVALVAKDPSSLVRDAACRALGLLAKSEPPLVSRKQDHAPAEAVRVLLGALTPVECDVEVQEGVQAAQLATSAAFWTLANCCDLLAGHDWPAADATQLLSVTLDSLAREPGDEQVRWNAALAASSLLAAGALSCAPLLLASLSSVLLSDTSFKALLSAAHAGSQLPGSTALALGEVLQQVRLDLDGGRVPLREQGHAERLIVQLTSLRDLLPPVLL